MKDEILTIPELKTLISQEEETIRVKRQSLKYHEDLLKDLQKRLDNSVVDGLRMKVREFIAQAKAHVHLRRVQQFKQEDRIPYLQDQSLAYSWKFCNLTEEEAIILSSQAGRQAYNIDCSIWDTYRYPGEID